MGKWGGINKGKWVVNKEGASERAWRCDQNRSVAQYWGGVRCSLAVFWLFSGCFLAIYQLFPGGFSGGLSVVCQY